MNGIVVLYFLINKVLINGNNGLKKKLLGSLNQAFDMDQ